MKLKPESEPYSEKYLFKSEIVHDLFEVDKIFSDQKKKKMAGQYCRSHCIRGFCCLGNIALHQYIKAEPQCKLYPVLLISTACAEVDASARMVVVLFIEHRLSENLFCGFNGRISQKH